MHGMVTAQQGLPRGRSLLCDNAGPIDTGIRNITLKAGVSQCLALSVQNLAAALLRVVIIGNECPQPFSAMRAFFIESVQADAPLQERHTRSSVVERFRQRPTKAVLAACRVESPNIR